MAEDLNDILEELKSIRTYLVKKGKERYKANIRTVKYNEAQVLINQFYILEKEFAQSVKQSSLPSSTVDLTNETFSKIKKLYEDIVNLCAVPESDVTMDRFDLKTAVSLLPIMDGSETITKQLISGIKMYASLLDDSNKIILIKFVLNTRLSETAKLRLSSSYESVSNLVKDMQKHLLTKKSYTSLQYQLTQCKQNRKPIDVFGMELEKLFTDLTISQADGNEQSYKVLFPINEKLAIRRFCDGLSDSRLSTIVAARNYDSLKDAIRGAQDEELAASPSTSSAPTMMPIRRGGRRPGRASFQRGASGQRGNYQNYYRGRDTHRGHYPRYSRGMRSHSGRFTSSFIPTSSSRRVNVMIPENAQISESGSNGVSQERLEDSGMNHFFRA